MSSQAHNPQSSGPENSSAGAVAAGGDGGVTRLPPETFAPRQPKLRQPPFAFIAIGLFFLVASWLPLVLFARARVSVSGSPRVLFMQDMGTQPKYREQASSEIFADNRGDRPRILGTVARGELWEDDHRYRGFTTKKGAEGKPTYTFFDTFPSEYKVDETFLKRGQERFNIYCAACHGRDGMGNGPVAERAHALQDVGGVNGWVPPANLTAPQVCERPVGHIFNTITNGIRNMPPYGGQVDVDDRWAIVAYVRALQLSQNAPPALIPADKKASMEVLPASATQPVQLPVAPSLQPTVPGVH